MVLPYMTGGGSNVHPLFQNYLNANMAPKGPTAPAGMSIQKQMQAGILHPLTSYNALSRPTMTDGSGVSATSSRPGGPSYHAPVTSSPSHYTSGPVNAHPVGTYAGSGASADVGAGDKVYRQDANGGFYNNVYDASGKQVGHYWHPNPTPAPSHAIPTPGGSSITTSGNGIGPVHNPTPAPSQTVPYHPGSTFHLPEPTPSPTHAIPTPGGSNVTQAGGGVGPVHNPTPSPSQVIPYHPGSTFTSPPPTYGTNGATANNGGYDSTPSTSGRPGTGPIHTTTGSTNVIGVANGGGVPNPMFPPAPLGHPPTTSPTPQTGGIPSTGTTGGGVGQGNSGGVSFTPVPNPTPTPSHGNGAGSTEAGHTGGTTPTPPVTGQGQGQGQGQNGQAGLDSLDQGLFDKWNNIMDNLGNTNNPAFQHEVEGLAQQLNNKYYQQWLTERDKMGGQGMGQSGFLNNDQLREQMAEQNDLAGQYGNLLQNYLKDQLSQATNYGDMMKTMMPYSNMTLDQRVAAEQNAQKLMDAQLNAAGYANINGTVDPTLAGLEAVGNQTGQFTNPYTGQTGSTLNAQKLWDQYNLLTPDQYATASGYLPSSYGGGPTLTNTNDALGRQLSLAGLTGMWNGQPTLQAQNDAQTRGNAAYGTQLSQDKGVVDTLGSQITSMRSANPADPQLQPGNVNGQPTLMQQYLDALNNYSSLAMSGGSGN